MREKVSTEPNVTDDSFLVNSEAVSTKAEVVKSTGTDCDVKSFSLDNFRLVMLDKNTALMTYTATQDAVCSRKPMPANVRVSAVYARRGGKWLQALYTGISVAQ